MKPEDILNFWFLELETKDWYKKDDNLDKAIKTRFESYHQASHNGELETWRETAKGSLAEILVLDQFSRNMFRNTPAAFASDELALKCSELAIEKGFDKELSDTERAFLYMPYMHSESKEVHEKAMELFKDLPNMSYEIAHKKIIDRFGRYPHRNDTLGRESTEEEIEFLKQPGSSF